MSKEVIMQARVSPKEATAWRVGAKHHRMTISQLIRSGVATFLVNGKRTIVVPAAPDLPYVEELRKEDESGEPVRGTTGLIRRRAEGMTVAEAKEAEIEELAEAARRARPLVTEVDPLGLD